MNPYILPLFLLALTLLVQASLRANCPPSSTGKRITFNGSNAPSPTNCPVEFNIFHDIAYSAKDKKFLIVGLCNKKIAYLSTDETGLDWTSVGSSWSYENLVELNSAAYGNNVYVAAGGVYSIVYSSDGQNWSLAKLPDFVESAYFHHLKFLNNTFLTGTAEGSVLVSKNGAEWSKVTVKENVPSEIYSFAYNGKNTFVAVGRASTDTLQSVIYSSDLISWKAASSLPIKVNLRDVVYSNKRKMFVAVGAIDDSEYQPYCAILHSLNGIDWTIAHNCTPSQEDNSALLSITYNEELDTFFAVGTLIAISRPGSGWTVIPKERYPRELYSCVYLASSLVMKDKIIAVGNYNMIWISTDAGNSFKEYGVK